MFLLIEQINNIVKIDNNNACFNNLCNIELTTILFFYIYGLKKMALIRFVREVCKILNEKGYKAYRSSSNTLCSV